MTAPRFHVSICKQILAAVIAAFCITGLAGHAVAECKGFDWPLEAEQEWFAAADIAVVHSAAKQPLTPGRGFTLKLRPVADSAFPVAPSRPDKAGSGYGGFVAFESVPKAGEVQVTLSSEGWIDIVQNGATLTATARTRDRGCATIRKSVRFPLAAGPFILMVGGSPDETIRVAVRPLD